MKQEINITFKQIFPQQFTFLIGCNNQLYKFSNSSPYQKRKSEPKLKTKI